MTFSTRYIAEGDSPIHGRGCYAAADIPADTIVGVFDGRWHIVPMGATEPEYPAELDSRYVIDVGVFRYWGRTLALVLNPVDGARFTPLDRINHAWEPNCRVHGLAVVTAGPIPAGTELTIDYRELDCTGLTFEAMAGGAA